jgi:hypothetical protein
MTEQRPDESLHDKVSSEHRRLEEMFEDLRAALRPQEGATGPGPVAAEILEKMREEVEAHFEVEERLYYPSIWALRPERRAPLAALLERHSRFLAQLEQVAGALQSGALPDAAALFETFSSEFGLHEEAEETILREVQQSLAPP